MGGGFYSHSSRSTRAKSLGYYDKPMEQIFISRHLDSEMNPAGVKVRESRDSEDHPNSVPIIIALDVTGSMRNVPHFLVKDGLPLIMTKIIQSGILDPQILFLAIGDHVYDDAPLQVGQFESSDELLDKWLTKVYLEGGGGGNEGESYSLAHYFAAHYTSIDSFEKRNQKGFLFTIGDEPTLKKYPKEVLNRLMKTEEYSDKSHFELLEEAQKQYNVYHLHISETGAGSRASTVQGWKELLGDNLIVVPEKSQVANIISNIVTKTKFNNISISNSNLQKNNNSEITML